MIGTEGDMNDERASICEVQGHRFSPSIMHLLEDPELNQDRLPDVALCIRCGTKIELAEII